MLIVQSIHSNYFISKVLILNDLRPDKSEGPGISGAFVMTNTVNLSIACGVELLRQLYRVWFHGDEWFPGLTALFCAEGYYGVYAGGAAGGDVAGGEAAGCEQDGYGEGYQGIEAAEFVDQE